MTPSDALQTLELAEGAPPEAIDRAYETLYNDVQLRIQNAPTPKLRTRFEERLVQIEAAYALLRGSTTSDEDLPSSAPVETTGATHPAQGGEAGRRAAEIEKARAKGAETQQKEDKRATKRKRIIAGVVGAALLLSAGVFFVLGSGGSAAGLARSRAEANGLAVVSLLAQARTYVSMEALDSPPGANAHETLEEIERLDPENPEVRVLRGEIATKYFERATAAADSSHWADAAQQFARMAAVAAEGSAEKRLALAREAEAVERRDETERQATEQLESQRQQTAASQQRAASAREAAQQQSAAARQALQAQFGSIHAAAQQGSIEGVEAFLGGGVGVNTTDNTGMSPLNHAVLSGHEAVARLLIQSGANVNAQNRRGSTPLHTAATIGHEPLVTLLIESGATVNARDQLFGETPLRKAQENGHEGIVRLLQRHGGV